MILPLPVLALLAFILVGACALAVRYVLLRRGLARYSRALRQDPEAAGSNGEPDIQALGFAVRQIVTGLSRRLADTDRERARLAATLDQMADGVLIADADGIVRLANPAARRLLGIEEPAGRTVAEVLRHHLLIAAWRRCLETGQAQTESVELVSRQRNLQLVAVPDRQQPGSLLFLQDLTQIRRLETVRRDFVSNLSHELRTPLASLKALAETLQNGALSDPQAGPQFLDRMVTEVDALTQMAQEMLDLSRIESGQVELQLASVQTSQVVTSAVERMKLQAERAGLILEASYPPDLPPIRADASRLEQVLVNLIHNAIKFTDPGGRVTVSARLGTESAPDRVGSDAAGVILLAVSDTGRGIPSDDLPRIFERFYRADKSRSGGGTGLGLSIARHLIEAHGGQIWADSIEGRGSTIYFTVPMAT